jgi:hypothetical protein
MRVPGLIAMTAASFAAAAAMPGLARADCSVFSHHHCAPATCSVFQRRPCQPDYGFPLGQDLRLTVETTAEKDSAARPEGQLNTIHDVFVALQACWLPPSTDEAKDGMEISVRFSFTRDGGILGEPRFTYLTHGVSQAVRTAYEHAVVAALNRCTPLPFTPALGGALAGRPFAIRFIDKRPRPGSHA